MSKRKVTFEDGDGEYELDLSDAPKKKVGHDLIFGFYDCPYTIAFTNPLYDPL